MPRRYKRNFNRGNTISESGNADTTKFDIDKFRRQIYMINIGLTESRQYRYVGYVLLVFFLILVASVLGSKDSTPKYDTDIEKKEAELIAQERKKVHTIVGLTFVGMTGIVFIYLVASHVKSYFGNRTIHALNGNIYEIQNKPK